MNRHSNPPVFATDCCRPSRQGIRRRKPLFLSIGNPAVFLLMLVLAQFAAAQTYKITDVSKPATTASFATGVNAGGQVAGYSTTGASAASGWRFTAGAGVLDLGNFGGADSRALGINDAGQVTGYSTDSAGFAHGFVFSTVGGLADIGGNGTGGSIFAQHINASGQVAGFSAGAAGTEQAFRFTPPGFMVNLATIPGAQAPATISAYGVNDAGRVVGVGTSVNGFNRAFRSDANGANVTDLGTLGGDESFAYAINNAGQVAGTSSSLSLDTHAFIFTDAAGMTDLGTLGGYVSSAFALDSAGNVVGAAQDGAGAMHAFVWSATLGMRDLNEFVPVNSGWVLTEARGINDAGVIVGSGTFNGQVRAFRLTPKSGADLAPPVAVAKAANITSISAGAQIFPVTFWDDVSVLNASVAQGAVRVTGPNGYSQVATFYNKAAVADAIKVVANFYVTSTDANALWTGATNGTYTISIEPNVVRDTAGNYMPGGAIGTFTVTTETKPLAYFAPVASPVTIGVPATYTLTAQSSYPSAAGDVFTFVIDWKNDGANLQTVTGVSGMTVTHTFSSTGTFNTRLVATDTHGVSSGDLFFPVGVVNPGNPQTWSAAPQLSNGRRLAVGLNASGTLLAIGGTPTNGPRAPVDALAPGATQFAQAATLPTTTVGLGAGIDSLNRVIVFGGIDSGAASPKATGFAYTTNGGAGAAIGVKNFAVHDFAFATDNAHRIYSIGGASSAGIGEQTFAITVTPIPSDTIQPTAPKSISLTARTATSVTLTWPAGADNIGVVSYNIYGFVRRTGRGAGSYIALVKTGVTTRSYIAPGSYSAYYVAAVDAAGNVSLLSTPVAASVLTLPVITRSNFNESTTVIVGNSLLLSLTATANPGPPTFSTFTGPAGLTVARTTGPNPLLDYAVVQWQPTAADVGVQTFTVSATNPNTTGGSATFTVTVLPNGTDTVKPTPVAQMTASDISFDHCTLTWTPAGDNIGVTNYHIVATHFGVPGVANHIITLDIAGANLTTSLTGLLPASGYNVAITPSDAAGNIGPTTSTLVFSTLTDPFVNFGMSSGTAHGTLALDWQTAGSAWLFTVEYTDSLATPNWQPVVPVAQWPSAITHFVVTPDAGVPSRFYRVVASAAP